MRIETLHHLLDPSGPSWPPPSATVADLSALEDTQVLDVRVDVARSRAGVLLEGRQSGEVPAGNAVVLVVTGLVEVAWTREGAAQRVHAFRVVGGAVTGSGSGSRVLLQCDPHADLVVAGRSVEAHFVAVPGLPAAPVDYAEDDATIRAGTPSWDSGGEVVLSWSLAAG